MHQRARPPTRRDDWPILASQTVADHGTFRITCDRVRSPRTGRESDVFLVHPHDWVQVVSLTADGRLVMVRQYRHGSRRLGLEVPGGAIEATDLSAAEGAARELAEETGYGGGCLVSVGELWSQPGLLGNRVRLFVADGVRRLAEPRPDADEEVAVQLVEPARLPHLIRTGFIHNAMTITALAMAQAAGHLAV